MRIPIVARRGFLALAAIAGPFAGVVSAQSRPVVYQHGLASNASTWTATSSRLASDYQIETHGYTTGSLNRYETQAGSLISQAAGVSASAFVIGHSNGGVVAREANREGRAWRAIVSVGTPHQGAALAQSVLSGALGQYVQQLANTTAAPVLYYDQFYEDNNYWNTFRIVAVSWNTFGNALPVFVGGVGFIIGDLLGEMSPPSGYLAGLNGAANTARENAAVADRVAIVSSFDDNNGIIFRALFSASAANTDKDAKMAAIGVFLTAYAYYAMYNNYDDPNWQYKVNHAYLWSDAAGALGIMDPSWCALIGATAACQANDGIVPAYSQSAPNSSRVIAIHNVSHLEETSADATYFALRGLFASGSLAIPPIGGAGGGLAIGGIEGPTYIYPGDSPVWSTSASGGQAPYTYVWTVNGTLVQSGSANTFSFFDTADFEVGVTVTDAAGTHISATHSVLYEGCGQIICGL